MKIIPNISPVPSLTDSPSRKITLYWLPKELVGGHRDGAEDEEGGGPAVVEAEYPVINGGLLISYLESRSYD